MMPLSAVWAGPECNDHLDGPPLLSATTGSHTPFRLVTHQGDVGHTLVVGPTGAGKSVLLSLLALQFRLYENAQVFIFDKGESAKAATLGMSGEHYSLGGDGALCFQPLARLDEEGACAWAQDWLTGLLCHEGVNVTPEVKEAVWTALNSLASAPQSERTLTGLVALLQSSKLRQALLPYTLEGAHGAALDADAETLGAADWQCFEMEELMHAKSLVLPVLTYLFHRLEARFDGRPTLLVLDEAWVFLDDPLFASRRPASRPAAPPSPEAQLADAARTSKLFFIAHQSTNGGLGGSAAPSQAGYSTDLASLLASPGSVVEPGIIPMSEVDPNRQERKEAFLGADVETDVYNPYRLQEPISPYQVMAGTIIPASLITGLNSDLPGQVIAQVTEHAYDTPTGQYLLIPQGSKLIGRYDSVIAYGQSRALVVWSRIVMPDGTSITIDNLPAVDMSGYAGLEDRVNGPQSAVYRE